MIIYHLVIIAIMLRSVVGEINHTIHNCINQNNISKAAKINKPRIESESALPAQPNSISPVNSLNILLKSYLNNRNVRLLLVS